MEDSFSSIVAATNKNFTGLSRTMAYTAKALGRGNISTDENYQRAMADITKRSFQQRLFSFQKRSPSEIIKAQCDQLPEELLHDIPEPATSYSLYAGYEAAVSNENTPEMQAIRKELAADELRSIERQIADLQEKRKAVFENVTGALDGSSRQNKTLLRFYPAGEQISLLNTGYDQDVPLSLEEPFGSLAVACGSEVQMWDLASNTLTHSHHAPRHTPVTCVQQQKNIVVAGTKASNIYLWQHGELEFRGHMGGITCIHLADPTLVSGSMDKTLRQWDVASGRCRQTLDVQEAGIPWCLQHFDAALATGTDDGLVRLWDLRSGAVVRKLAGHESPVTSLQFDNQHLVSGSADGSVRIHDLRGGNVVDAFNLSCGILNLRFDNEKIAAATGEPGVRIYDLGTKEHTLVGSSEVAGAVSVALKDGYLVEGRKDGKVGIWAV